MGAAFNGFSLEYPDLEHQLDVIGKSADAEVIELHGLLRHYEQLSDSLKEILLFCDSIGRCLNNYAAKKVDLEDFHDQINAKKNALMQMESTAKANDEASEQYDLIKKTKHSIEQLENSKRSKQSEMLEYTNRTVLDVERTFLHFGNIWRTSLKTLAEFQCKWHESACSSWKQQ